MDKKKEMRKQINEILGREVTDAEFQGIDFSGVIEDLEPNYDDFSSSIIGPMSIIAAGMACILMGISIHDRFAFLGVAYSVGTVSFFFGWAFLWRKERAVARTKIMEAIKKYEERARVSK